MGLESAYSSSVEDLDKLKSIACNVIDEASDSLRKLSLDIWNHPELYYEEEHAHAVLTDFLEDNGFKVERHYKLQTAFRACAEENSDNGPHVAVMSEYDALPEIGHGCGHNLIAILGVGASLGIKAAMAAAAKPLGKLTLLGTPAEEGGGGKVDLINAGVYKQFDMALMAHPGDMNATSTHILSCHEVSVTFRGKASHSAGSPWKGINALDAAVMGYTAVSNFRQQMRPSWMVHGIITNGGAKPNIIPEEASLYYYLRTPTMGELEAFSEKIEGCFRGAALATGCTVEFAWDPKPYKNMLANTVMTELYESNCTSVGGWQKCENQAKLDAPTGSTDMGNVSHEVPSIHPHYYIGDIPAHTKDFREAAGTTESHELTLLQAKSLAMTAIDIMAQPQVLSQVKHVYAEQIAQDAAANRN